MAGDELTDEQIIKIFKIASDVESMGNVLEYLYSSGEAKNLIDHIEIGWLRFILTGHEDLIEYLELEPLETE
jgi:hypothetical protein